MRAPAGVSAVVIGIAVALTAAGDVFARSALPTESAACPQGRATPTTLIADGDLYTVVRAARRRFLFGSSDRPVLSFGEALRLIRALRFTGTTAQLLDRLEGSPIPGSTYGDGGAIGYFSFSCRGIYTATTVVRSQGGSIPATRFWLQQGQSPHVGRAFSACRSSGCPRARSSRSPSQHRSSPERLCSPSTGTATARSTASARFDRAARVSLRATAVDALRGPAPSRTAVARERRTEVVTRSRRA